MKKKIFSILFALVLVLSFSLIPAAPAAAQSTYYVATTGNDVNDGSQANPWLTIQHAIDAANAGDTIIVHDGTYHENVRVTKSLTIKSVNGADSTTVKSTVSWVNVFTVAADYVTITGFTVTGATGPYCGIFLDYADNCNISENKATDNKFGIRLLNASNNAIETNTCWNNYDLGIHLDGFSGNNTVRNNTCSNNNYGIYLGLTHIVGFSGNNVIENNSVTSNNYVGIHTDYSHYNLITGNTATGSTCGIQLSNASTYNTVEDNTCLANNQGIVLDASSNNTIRDNVCQSNFGRAIFLVIADSNTIDNNAFSNNGDAILLSSSENNQILRNEITNNNYGIRAIGSGGNGIFHNNFINNGQQAYDDGIDNVWDNGYPSGGNYWSDYTGVDEKKGSNQDEEGSDGIVDAPYDILGPAGNQDRYPFMRESGWANQPPVADAGGSYLGNESWAVTFDASGSSDPEGGVLQYRWDFDSDQIWDTDWLDVPMASYTWGDDYSGTVTVEVSDGQLTDTAIADVTVNNVAPTVGEITAPVDPVEVNTAINASADFTDPGTLDTHTAVWDWGDGSDPTIQEDVVSPVTTSHTYTAAGVYTVTLTVTDDDGSSGESVFEFVVVYDPSAGFVTGGGWIDSPAGAYAADPALTGKANFGFVSKYKKGATVPVGVTEFQFRVANLNFHSASYEWLVIAGTRAQYKGIGTINGQGEYKFLLTAIDANINENDAIYGDRFRIKIWSEDNSGNEIIVYDNGLEAEDFDNEDVTTGTIEIGGGSIVIHQK